MECPAEEASAVAEAIPAEAVAEADSLAVGTPATADAEATVTAIEVMVASVEATTGTGIRHIITDIPDTIPIRMPITELRITHPTATTTSQLRCGALLP